MRTIFESVTAGACAPALIICLPAAYTGPEDFLQAGFLSAVRDRELPVDLAFAHLNLQHLIDRTILRRLRHEIVLPARAQGCESIWFCGISLGGFLALAYAEKYPDEVNGLCLLAPYLGNRIVAGEIEQAGGLERWQPGKLAPDDDERRIWRLIQSVRAEGTLQAAGSLQAPGPLQSGMTWHLGFGREDRFAASHRMMAAALPPDRVHVIPGGHDWPVWRQLWDNFLDRWEVTLGPSRTRQTLDTTATD
ncbi:MAG TPA: alpha/beta fold hydrolase [Steroidobacteraceae bacterium]|jgi:pimeloyl-ACP methyl ester carboxylesterase